MKIEIVKQEEAKTYYLNIEYIKKTDGKFVDKYIDIFDLKYSPLNIDDQELDLLIAMLYVKEFDPRLESIIFNEIDMAPAWNRLVTKRVIIPKSI